MNLDKMGIQIKQHEMKVDITMYQGGKDDSSLVPEGIGFTEWVKAKTKTLEYLKPLTLLFKQLLRNHKLDIRYYGIDVSIHV